MQKPQSLQEGQAFVGRTTSKLFYDDKVKKERPYAGEVKKVRFSKKWGLLFYVWYPEDDDKEELTWEGLEPTLLEEANAPAAPPPAVQQQRKRGSAAGVKRERVDDDSGTGEDQDQGAANRPGSRKQPRHEPQQHEEEEEEPAKEEEEEETPKPQRGKRRQHKRKQPEEEEGKEGEEQDAADSDAERPAARGGGGSGQRRSGQPAAPAAGGSAPRRGARGSGAADMDAGVDDNADGVLGELGDEDGEEDLEGDMERCRAADALAQRQAAEAQVREEGLPGHVKRIKLVNFMCHANFEMEFSSHVNFVSGENGSGKSAVLQALQICLGATARETGRGRSLRELIKSGCSAATLSVTLWNTGDDAYQPQKLGRWVTIERQISKAGEGAGVNTTWKVYGQDGRTVPGATRKNLIEPLLDHLNIAAENPLCVMTQDKAREFLASASQSTRILYELFMDATLMGEFKANLQKTQGMVSQMKDKVEEIQAAYKAKDEELKQLRDKLDKLRASRQYEEQREALELASVWALVREREAGLAAMDESLTRMASSRRQEEEARVAELDRRISELKEQQAQLAEQQAQQNAFAQEVLAGLHELQAAMKAAHKEVAQLVRANQQAEDSYKETQQEMEQLMESIAEATQQTGAPGNELVQKIEQQKAEMQALQRQKEQLESKLGEEKALRDRAHERLRNLEQEDRDLGAGIRASESTLLGLQNDRAGMQASAGNRLSMFGGPQMVELCRLVERNGRKFEQLPIGPMGAFLSLTDDRWGKAAEAVMGGMLDSWIVNSHRDEKVLRSIADQARVRVTIITKRFDRPPYKVPPQIAAAVREPYTLLRELVVIDHPQRHVIDKLLIDTCHYERVVLTESESAARDVAYEKVLGPLITTCVAVSGLKAMRSGPGKLPSTQPDRSRRGTRLGGDVATNLSAVEEAIKVEQSRLTQLQDRCNQLRGEAARTRQALQEATSAYREACVQKNSLERCIFQLLNETQAHALLPTQEDVGDEDDEVQAKLVALQGSVAATQAAKMEAEAELQEAREREASARQQYEERKAQVEAAQQDVSRAAEELQRVSDQLQTAAARRNRAVSELQSMEAQLAERREEREKLAAEIDARRAAALEICSEEEGDQALTTVRAMVLRRFRMQLEKEARKERGLTDEERAERVERELAELETDPAPDIISQMHAAVDRKIKAALQDAGGSEVELRAQEARLAASAEADRSLVETVVDIHRRTRAALRRRHEGYTALFDSVQKEVSHSFMRYMQRRRHQGKIRIKDNIGELQLMLKLHQGGADGGASAAAGGSRDAKRADRAVTDLKQLSGGERSYTNVAFMLALGEYVEAPFRCMDEYDVFMDATNRLVATTALLQFAVEKHTVQHIFLTPQDISAIGDARKKLEERFPSVADEGFLRIMRLRAPREHH